MLAYPSFTTANRIPWHIETKSMKWAITCPDGIGDFLLRLPWLFAMERLGWETLLLARSPTIEVAKLAGLKARCHELTVNPYSKEAKTQKDPFRAERRAIQRFSAELVFFAPSHPTMLEEELAFRLRGLKIGGFVLEGAFWPSESISSPKEISARYDIKVSVSNNDPEPLRNAKAAGALAGVSTKLEPFHFPKEYRQKLSRNLPSDFQSRDYLAVSPGYRAGDYFSGLGTARWTRQLLELESITELRFLFTGSSSEAASNADILAGLHNRDRHVDLTGKLDRLSDLLPVLYGGQGYIGKDSGTMHLAAALEMPVVAVFGGGHGKRFLPVGTKGVALTVAVPCRDCNWRCHLKEPLCVTDLREGAVAQAWLAMPGLNDREIQSVEQTPTVDAQRVLSLSPGTGYPARLHRLRSEMLKEERKRALAPFFRRVLRRLAPFLSH